MSKNRGTRSDRVQGVFDPVCVVEEIAEASAFFVTDAALLQLPEAVLTYHHFQCRQTGQRSEDHHKIIARQNVIGGRVDAVSNIILISTGVRTRNSPATTHHSRLRKRYFHSSCGRL